MIILDILNSLEYLIEIWDIQTDFNLKQFYSLTLNSSLQ